jgi:hypothetical protein
MPRIRQSSSEAYIGRLHRQIDGMSTAKLRRALKTIVEHCYEAQSMWSLEAGTTREDEDAQKTLTINDYYIDSEIHYMIVEGIATREDIEKCINDSSDQNPASIVVKLVELGIDLIIHRHRWLSTDLDALHGQIQVALLKELKEDVWVHEDTCDRMDDLCGNVWYSRLLTKLKEDEHALQNRDWTEECKWVDKSAETTREGGGSGNGSQQG